LIRRDAEESKMSKIVKKAEDIYFFSGRDGWFHFAAEMIAYESQMVK
jgi:hypothetical protein